MSVWKLKTGKWTAKFWFQNQQYQKKGIRTRALAQKWEATKKEELQKTSIETPLISFQELATKYLEYCQLRFQRNTWKAKAHYYRTYQAFLNEDTPIESIHKHSIVDYLNDVAKKKGSKTANRHLKDLKALYNWGIKHDFLNKSPFNTIDFFAEDEFVKYVPPRRGY